MAVFRRDRSYWKSILGILEILIMVKFIHFVNLKN
jgi:hypothetical protein